MFRITSLFSSRRNPSPGERSLSVNCAVWSTSGTIGATARRNFEGGEEDENSGRARPFVVFANQLLHGLLVAIQAQIHGENRA